MNGQAVVVSGGKAFSTRITPAVGQPAGNVSPVGRGGFFCKLALFACKGLGFATEAGLLRQPQRLLQLANALSQRDVSLEQDQR